MKSKVKFAPSKREVVYYAMRDLENKIGYPPAIRLVADKVKLSRTAINWHMKKLFSEGKIFREARPPQRYTVKEQ